MAYVIVFVLLLAVVLVITTPFRRGAGVSGSYGGEGAPDAGLPSAEEQERIELEAAREAKLREIRDAELDHQTGKLSDADFEAIDSQLRAEAISLITKLDELDGSETPEDGAEVVADATPGTEPAADEQAAE